MVQNGLYAISHVWPSGSEKYPEYPPQKAFCGSFTTVAPWFFSRGEFWGRDIKFLLTKRSKSDASQSGTSSSLVKPFFSPSLCARSSNCQKSFRCASSILSRSVFSVTGNSTAQGRPFFVMTTDLSDGNSLTILLSLALTSRRLSIFIARTPFHLSITSCLFCARSVQR